MFASLFIVCVGDFANMSIIIYVNALCTVHSFLCRHSVVFLFFSYAIRGGDHIELIPTAKTMVSVSAAAAAAAVTTTAQKRKLPKTKKNNNNNWRRRKNNNKHTLLPFIKSWWGGERSRKKTMRKNGRKIIIIIVDDFLELIWFIIHNAHNHTHTHKNY